MCSVFFGFFYIYVNHKQLPGTALQNSVLHNLKEIFTSDEFSS